MRYIILQASIDGPTCEDDGLSAGIGFGLASPKIFDTLEEAKKEQQLIAEDTLADLNVCYNGDVEDEEEIDYKIEGEIQHGRGGDLEVVFMDRGYEINTTVIRIEEVNF